MIKINGFQRGSEIGENGFSVNLAQEDAGLKVVELAVIAKIIYFLISGNSFSALSGRT